MIPIILRIRGSRVNPGLDQYPSITGASGCLYDDHALREAARDRSHIKGRMLQEAQRKVWDWMNKVVDLSAYPPKGKHTCARSGTMQELYIDAQNLLYSNRDRVKDPISESGVVRRLIRTYEEARAQFEKIEDLVEAYEMGMGKKPGSD